MPISYYAMRVWRGTYIRSELVAISEFPRRSKQEELSVTRNYSMFICLVVRSHLLSIEKLSLSAIQLGEHFLPCDMIYQIYRPPLQLLGWVRHLNIPLSEH